MSDETNEHVPNYVISKQEACGVTVRCVRFYPEDVEKLKKLEEESLDEYLDYKGELKKAGRYVYDSDDGQKEWRRALVASGIALRTEKVVGIEWTYTVKDGAASIGDGFGVAIPPSTTGEITIPLTLDGCPVTRIGDRAFRGCRGLTGVKIPDSVTSIGDGAFDGCQGLTNVTIPANVTRIGNEAFSHCSALTSVTIPASVSRIGANAFQDCLRLKSVTVLGDVANISIGENAFGGCSLNIVDAPASKKAGKSMHSGISYGDVKRAWEGDVEKNSWECIGLLKEKASDYKDRRGNISRLLQAAFAIIPKGWNISNACDAGQYFLSFCQCLGLSPRDISDKCYSSSMALLTESRTAMEIAADDDDLIFEFTYGKSADDALRRCESRKLPTCFGGAKTRHLFGVNYNPVAHNIDKPLTTSFYSSRAPNFAISPMNGDDEVFAWRSSSRDECGRGDDDVPMDVNDVALWLRQKRERKEQEKEEAQRIQQEQPRRWLEQEGHGDVQPHGSPYRTDFNRWHPNDYDKRYEALPAVAVAIAIGVLVVFLYLYFFVR